MDKNKQVACQSKIGIVVNGNYEIIFLDLRCIIFIDPRIKILYPFRK